MWTSNWENPKTAEAERGDGREPQMRLKSSARSRRKLGCVLTDFLSCWRGGSYEQQCLVPACKQVSFIQEVSPIVYGTVSFQRCFQSKHQKI